MEGPRRHSGRGGPVRAVVIAVGREFVNTRGAFLERFVAVALQYQARGTPDIDLGYHHAENCRLAVEKLLTPIIARFANLHVKVAADGTDIDR